MNAYRADLFVNVPYIITDNNIFNMGLESKTEKKGNNAELYLKTMDTVFSYECTVEMYALTQRTFIGRHRIECESDSSVHEKSICGFDADMFITSAPKSGLSILTVVVLDEQQADISFMLEELNRGNGRVKFWGEGIPLDKFMSDVYGMSRCGQMKSMLSISDVPPDKDELLYLIAAEQYGTQEIDSSLKENPLLTLRDISQYDYANVYATEAAVVSVMKVFDEDISIRLYHEALIEQIIEVVMFKLTAIERTNRKAVAALETGELPETRVFDNLAVEFASTIRFWDTDNFIYFTTRNIAKEISAAFLADEKMAAYDRNRVMLEHIIAIRSAQSSEKEERVLNFLAIALTLLQVIPIFYSVFSFVLFGDISLKEVISTVASASTVALVGLVLIHIVKHGKKRY